MEQFEYYEEDYEAQFDELLFSSENVFIKYTKKEITNLLYKMKITNEHLKKIIIFSEVITDLDEQLRIFFDIDIFPNEEDLKEFLNAYHNSYELLLNYPIYCMKFDLRFDNIDVICHQIKFRTFNFANNYRHLMLESKDEDRIKKLIFSDVDHLTLYDVKRYEKIFNITYDDTCILYMFIHNHDNFYIIYDISKYFVKKGIKFRPMVCYKLYKYLGSRKYYNVIGNDTDTYHLK